MFLVQIISFANTTESYLLFDCKSQRGEDFFDVAVHGSSFGQLHPQALIAVLLLLLLTQADRR